MLHLTSWKCIIYEITQMWHNWELQPFKCSILSLFNTKKYTHSRRNLLLLQCIILRMEFYLYKISSISDLPKRHLWKVSNYRNQMALTWSLYTQKVSYIFTEHKRWTINKCFQKANLHPPPLYETIRYGVCLIVYVM